jgi:hypothetical protein
MIGKGYGCNAALGKVRQILMCSDCCYDNQCDVNRTTRRAITNALSLVEIIHKTRFFAAIGLTRMVSPRYFPAP